MRLTKLELNGFKSFARRTELQFDGGITAVIGPNGSGKSNIADAVRWVLGEQSAKALRGTRMEDVIFNGTQQRKAQAYCEVTLTFDNTDGKLRTPFSEVAVTRRVYRSGESEYLLNKNNCRLRDIQDLFHDTGIGKDGYSIISQGKVDEILSNKSDERRAAFEEAAGVMRYRVRKAEAERKLENTEKNLVRISDILKELGDRLEPLEAQSTSARRYLLLRDELRDLEVNLYLYQHARTNERIKQINDAIERMEEEQNVSDAGGQELLEQCDTLDRQVREMDAALSVRQNALLAQLAAVETHVGESKLLAEKAEHARAEQQRILVEREENAARRAELEETLAKMLGDEAQNAALSLLEQDIDASAQRLSEADAQASAAEETLESLKQSIIDAMNRLSDARSNRTRFDAMMRALSERRDAIKTAQAQNAEETERLLAEQTEAKAAFDKKQEGRAEVREELDGVQHDISAAEQAFRDAQQEKNTAEQAVGSETSKLKVLQEMARSREGYYNSVRNLMRDAEKDAVLKSRIKGVLAELIRVPKAYETAVSMALGASMQNIVTETAEDAQFVIEYLRRRDYGRATMLPIAMLRTNRLDKDDRLLVSAAGFIGIAADLVSCDEAIRPVLEHLLGRTVIVDDMNKAIALKRRYGANMQIATLRGDIIAAGGSMTGGSIQKRGYGILGREREIEETGAHIAKLRESLAQIGQRINGQEKKLLLLHTQADAFTEMVRQQDLTLVREREKLDIIARDVERAHAQATALANEQAQIDENLCDIERQKAEAVNAMQDIESGNAATREDVAHAQGELARLREARETQSQTHTSLLVRRMALVKERDAAASEQKRITEECVRLKNRIAQEDEGLKQTEEQLLNWMLRCKEMEKGISGEQEAAQREKDEQQKLEETRAQAYEALSQLRKRREELLQDARETGERRHRQEMQKSRAEMELAAMQDRIWEEYELTYENALPLQHEIPIQTSQSRVSAIKNEIHTLGDVNIASIEDYQAVLERHTTLTAQNDDLTKAKADIETLIGELTATMEAEFLIQFAAIQHNFTEVFAELFGGGHAELRLADRKDALNCEIDIIAQPPGKKLQLLSLLSGGERALTAIALLFAMLRLKPPAFCVLDEIESSLDEVNVSRFAEYLRAYSEETQFIIITHRKGSMEVCDSLYGVSMEEKGVSKIVSARFGETEAAS